MRFVNPKADKEKFKKLKAKRRAIVAIPLIVALAVAIALLLTVFKDIKNIGVIFEVEASILFVGAVIAFILHVHVFRRALEQNQDGVEVDFNSNIAVCNLCGRYFSFSELQLKVKNNVSESTFIGENKTITTYTGGVSVDCECPNCKTKKGVVIQLEVGEDITTTKREIASDNVKETRKSEKKSEAQLFAEVKSIYEKELKEAQWLITLNLHKGYEIDKNPPQEEEQDKANYEVFLFGSTEYGDTVVEIIKRFVYGGYDKAVMIAESGGIITRDLSRQEADELVDELTKAGAKAEKKVMN